MDSNILDAIIDNSDSYSFKLWNRYQHNKPISEEESVAFSLIQKLNLNSDSGFHGNLKSFLANTSIDVLPQSFFNPGSIADIFINYHSEAMNHVVHSHTFFEISYVCKGSISDWIDGSEISLQQGELCIHNPNARHKIVKMKKEEDLILNILLPQDMFQHSFYSMLMQNKELDQFFNNFMISTDSCSNFMVFHDTSNRVDTIIELLAQEFLRGVNASRFVLESTLVVLFGELMRNYKSNPFTQQLIAFITENLTDVSIMTAAKEFGYHKNYFPNIVKARTGYTFLELVTNIRVQKATNYLLFTKYSIEEISNRIGYKSTASFYCHFKKAYRVTPDQYRQEHL